MPKCKHSVSLVMRDIAWPKECEMSEMLQNEESLCKGFLGDKNSKNPILIETLIYQGSRSYEAVSNVL